MTYDDLEEAEVRKLTEYLKDWAITDPEVTLILGNVRRIMIAVRDATAKACEVEEREKPKTKCINIENHLFGSCFSCKEIDGWNNAVTAQRENYEKFIT